MFFVPSNPAEIAYIDKEDGELVLKIYRPSSTLHGITNEPRETVISGMGQLLAAHPGMSADNLFVDSEQELLVYAFSTRVFDDEGYPESYTSAECGFASLSGQRIDFESHHPLTAYSTITACITFLLEPSEFCFEVQVLGDLVVWRAGEDHGGADGLADILVYNWKTGVNVWHSHAFDYAGRVRVELLSPSRLVIIDSNDFTMRLYQFDSERSTDCPLSWDSYDCLCVLKLPEWHKRAPSFLFVGMAESFLAHLPDLHAPETQQATFLPDPALATLVLRISFTYAEFEYRSWYPETVWKEERDERYLVFIPLTTLMRFPERSKLAQEKPPTIPWDDWGPLGTRVIRVEPHWYQPLSVVGAYTAELSRCIFDGRNATRDCILSVYEVHPFAAFVPPSHWQYKNAETGEREAGTVTASSGGPFERLFTPDEDWIHDSTAWKAPIHTTYPIRKTTRVIPSMTEDGKYLRGMRMMHGKLILFRSELDDT